MIAANKITDSAYVLRAMLNKGDTAGESADQRIASIKLSKPKDARYELVTHVQDERADLLVTGAARLGTFMARCCACRSCCCAAGGTARRAAGPCGMVVSIRLLHPGLHAFARRSRVIY